MRKLDRDEHHLEEEVEENEVEGHEDTGQTGRRPHDVESGRNPTRALTPFQEAATARAVRVKVSMSMMRLRPSTARWKRMPS